MALKCYGADVDAFARRWEVLSDQPPAAQLSRMRFRFRLRSCWINGELNTVHRRLIDVLNVEHAEVLVAEKVSVQQCFDVSCTIAVVDCATINTSGVLFAVPLEETNGSPAPPNPLAWVKKRPEQAITGIGPYQITGNVYLPEGSQLRDAFVAVRDRFFAVARAVIRLADNPDFVEEHNVVFVNRELMDFVAPAPDP